MIALGLLAILSITDGAFAGYRDAAGRDPRIFKERTYRAALRRGMAAGFVVCLLTGALACVVLLVTPLASLSTSASAMLLVLAPYATITLVILGLWVTAEADVRTLSSVIALGPLTLVRPFVIVAAGALATWQTSDRGARAVVLAACALQLAIEPTLAHARRRWGRPTPDLR